MATLTPIATQRFLDGCVDLCTGDGGQTVPVVEIADRFQRSGIGNGDLVFIALPNGKPLLSHYFALLSLGAAPGLIPPDTPPERIADLVAKTGASGFVGRRVATRLAGASESWEFAGCRVQSFPRSLARMETGEAVLLTSGTSGFSSGCVFEVKALLENAKKHVESIGQHCDDVVLVTLPLCYSFAFVAQALGAFVAGSQLVLAPPPFTPGQYCRTIAEYGVSVSSLTPSLVRSLVKKKNTFPSDLRVLTVGGDALAEEHVIELLRQRPHRELYVTYGLTQAGPRVSTFAAHREPTVRFASVGLPLRGVTVSLAPGNANDERELMVQSDTLMRRRVGMVEGRQTDDLIGTGLLATGDVFRQDDNGYLYFQGRRSDFILFNGEKVCLASIRRIANTLPHVIHASVLHQRSGGGRDELELALSIADGAEVFEESILRLLRRKLRPAERPTRVRVQSRLYSQNYK